MDLKNQKKAKNLKHSLMAKKIKLSRDKQQSTEDQPKVMKP